MMAKKSLNSAGERVIAMITVMTTPMMIGAITRKNEGLFAGFSFMVSSENGSSKHINIPQNGDFVNHFEVKKV